MKRIVIIITNVVFGFIALAAEPTVTDVVAKQRFPWNGLVDITCNVSGIDGTTNGLYLAVAAVCSGTTNYVSHLWVVQNGRKAADYAVRTNGIYQLLWDAQADLGAVIYSNMVVRVTFDSHVRVQLWEGGPCWATTNIGAEQPWESGYYFWWGDTVGYKHVNGAWVASDGSSFDFRFYATSSIQTRNKSTADLKHEGWTTEDNILAPEHDAARVQWGGGWRIPTDMELNELVSNCDWTWTTTNGVNGYIVCGRDSCASNSIFLPCAGSGFENYLRDPGSDGYYWSSAPYWYMTSDSWSLILDSDKYSMYQISRYLGCCVRPVQGGSE